jgi:hypothetical protein
MRLRSADFNNTFTNISIDSNNQTINNEENPNHCNMFGSFAMYVQIVLAGLSFMILICNYY